MIEPQSTKLAMRRIEVLHGLTNEPERHRYRLRLTIGRGKKKVGKRITISLSTGSEQKAIFARDSILDFCGKIGLTVADRPQKRPAKHSD
jgi:hypothetical protein